MRRGALGLAALAVMAVVHELLAWALDSADLIERLLAPGPEALIAIPAALLLYALRLGLLFVGPGVALLCVLSIASNLRSRASARPSAPPLSG